LKIKEINQENPENHFNLGINYFCNMKLYKQVLITGTNGLLGRKLVDLLLQQTHFDIIATSRGNDRFGCAPQYKHRYTYYPLDITQEADVELLFKKIDPEIIVHSAAMTKVDDCEVNQEAAFLTNVTATQYLLRGAKKWGSFFLYVSTDFVFDGKKGFYTEQDSPSPINYYGVTKLAAEKLVQNSYCDWAIVRTVLVYGVLPDMSRSNIVLWVKASLSAGKMIKVVDDQLRTPTLAEDLAEGCKLIIAKKATGIFHIAGSDLLTPYQMALQTADFFGLDKSLITPTNANFFVETGTRPLKTGCDISKARQLLGYEPHTFAQGLEIIAEQSK
jgi:dTDP-4-dehydrorhamnose reductase